MWALLALFALPLLLPSAVSAQASKPEVPPLTGRVVDRAGVLTPDQRAEIEDTLAAFERRKGSQVAVLIVETTEPWPLEQYSIRVAEVWKLGREKSDDGAILLVAVRDRAMRIEVGHGLEGALTDLVSKRIIADIITPHFRKGDMAGGIKAGVGAMLMVIEGEELPPPEDGPGGPGRRDWGGLIPFLFILFFGVAGVARALLGRFLGGAVGGGAMGAIGWALTGSLALGALAAFLGFLFIAFGGLMGGGRYRGGRGGFGGIGGLGGFGGRGGGFGGGGGFRGGGGSFGGGGASGRW